MVRNLLLTALFVVSAQASGSTLFEDQTVLEVQLVGPVGALVKTRKAKPRLPFVLVANGDEHDVELRAAGKSRLRVCNFPMLRFRFNEVPGDGSIFAGQDRLKLVTHCRTSAAAQANTIQEYITYRIFGLVSDVGYRVRLMRITYVDTGARQGAEPLVRYGFALESKRELGQRVGGEPLELPGVSLGSLDLRQMARVYVFQYLIGNTDWSLVTAHGDDACCHNGDIFAVGAARFYVPYDFDQSGLVNASYARPDPSLGLQRVTQRRYRGFCMSSEELRHALADFERRRSETMALIERVAVLTSAEKKSTQRFLGKFFAEAEDAEKLLQRFTRHCLSAS